MYCKIRKIEETDEGVNPLIVNFQNGKIEKRKDIQNLESAILKDQNNDNIIGAVAVKDKLYTGTADTNDIYNSFLLLRDRESGEGTLIEVNNVTLSLHLKRKSDATVSTPLDKRASAAELNKTFGSKRAKRITEQRERMQMDIENVKEQLENTVANVTIDESDLIAATTTEQPASDYLPKINRDASTTEQVYVLNDLVPDSVLKSLEIEANRIVNSDVDNEDLVPFVKKCLKEVSSSRNIEQKSQILLFVNYLLKFHVKGFKEILVNMTACNVSSQANNHILNNFSILNKTGNRSKRMKPPYLKDKALCYIMVLLMIALDYELNIEELSKDCKVGLKKLGEVGRVLAFSQKNRLKSVLVLKLPLPPPVTAQRNKKGRK